MSVSKSVAVPVRRYATSWNGEGRLKIGHGEVAGRRAIRLVCVNPDLNEGDLRAILGEIKTAAASCQSGDNQDGNPPLSC